MAVRCRKGVKKRPFEGAHLPCLLLPPGADESSKLQRPLPMERMRGPRRRPTCAEPSLLPCQLGRRRSDSDGMTLMEAEWFMRPLHDERP